MAPAGATAAVVGFVVSVVAFVQVLAVLSAADLDLACTYIYVHKFLIIYMYIYTLHIPCGNNHFFVQID